MTAFEAAHAEVVRLHDFLGAWFRGELSADRLAPDFADALHPSFENVQPAGVVLDRAAIVEAIGTGHAANQHFRIAIEEPRLLAEWPGLILFQYVEFQTGARASAPENRRRSTVLFETGERLVWRYLIEVGLPG